MARLQGVRANPLVLQEVLGSERVLHPGALSFDMQGARILVLLDEVPETYRDIYLPEMYRDTEQMGSGIVIACGPLVGLLQPPYPGGFSGEPEELLYQHVTFGAHAGQPIRLDQVRDSQYVGAVLCMTDRDIWCINDSIYSRTVGKVE